MSVKRRSCASSADYFNKSVFTYRVIGPECAAFNDVGIMADTAEKLDCNRCESGIEEMAKHTVFLFTKVRPFWDYVGELTTLIGRKQFVFIDVAYICDNMFPSWSGVKGMVFLMFIDVTRMAVELERS